MPASEILKAFVYIVLTAKKEQSAIRNQIYPSQAFRGRFSQKRLKEGFYRKVRRKNTKGVDRADPIAFEKNLNDEIKVVSRKCLKGTYKFSPYLELLKLKGKGKKPRFICIRTVRDRIVLYQLKELLFDIFPDCVRRKTSRNYIQEINSYIALKEGAELAIIYGDIKEFYDSIDRDILFERLGRRIRSKRILSLIRKAIESPVMAKGYRRSDLRKYELSKKGIPQGLAISNVLASIYLSDFDKMMNKQGGKYFRYIDDILFICDKEEYMSIQKEMKAKIEGRRFQLKLHKIEKEFAGDSKEGFNYLGYYFMPNGLVSVSESSIERYIEGVASKFTAYSKRKRYTIEKDRKLTKEERKNIFVRELNLKITGAISEDRRYGWVFYYSEINDLSVLHRIDRCISRFFKRIKDFPEGPPSNIKRLSRAFYESKYSPDNGYIHDYTIYRTVQKKQSYLLSKGEISKKKDYTPEQIEALFTNCVYRETSELENDERNIYPLA